MVLAWENFWRFLFIFVHFVIIAVLHLSSFVDVFHFVGVVSLFVFQAICHVTGTPHWLLRLVKVSTSSELYPDYFRSPFLFHLPRALQFWVGIFYPKAFFTLRSSPTFLAHSPHFGTTSFYQGFAGSRQLLFWKLQGFILILETQTRPICLFDSQ